MYIHFWSALFGAVVAAALFIIINQVYYRIFGGKELRKLKRENRELKKTVSEKDKYIRKSLEELDKELNNRQNKPEE